MQNNNKIVMDGDCPENLNKMTEIMKNGMAFVFKTFKFDNLEFLQHGTCETSVSCDYYPYFKIQNLRFITKDFVNPLETYRMTTPPKMESNQPRFIDSQRFRPILSDPYDYSGLSRECEDRAMALDQFCHGLNNDSEANFMDFRDESGQCTQENVI